MNRLILMRSLPTHKITLFRGLTTSRGAASDRKQSSKSQTITLDNLADAFAQDTAEGIYGVKSEISGTNLYKKVRTIEKPQDPAIVSSAVVDHLEFDKKAFDEVKTESRYDTLVSRTQQKLKNVDTRHFFEKRLGDETDLEKRERMSSSGMVDYAAELEAKKTLGSWEETPLHSSSFRVGPKDNSAIKEILAPTSEKKLRFHAMARAENDVKMTLQVQTSSGPVRLYESLGWGFDIATLIRKNLKKTGRTKRTEESECVEESAVAESVSKTDELGDGCKVVRTKQEEVENLANERLLELCQMISDHWHDANMMDMNKVDREMVDRTIQDIKNCNDSTIIFKLLGCICYNKHMCYRWFFDEPGNTILHEVLWQEPGLAVHVAKHMADDYLIRARYIRQQYKKIIPVSKQNSPNFHYPSKYSEMYRSLFRMKTVQPMSLTCKTNAIAEATADPYTTLAFDANTLHVISENTTPAHHIRIAQTLVANQKKFCALLVHRGNHLITTRRIFSDATPSTRLIYIETILQQPYDVVKRSQRHLSILLGGPMSKKSRVKKLPDKEYGVLVPKFFGYIGSCSDFKQVFDDFGDFLLSFFGAREQQKKKQTYEGSIYKGAMTSEEEHVMQEMVGMVFRKTLAGKQHSAVLAAVIKSCEHRPATTRMVHERLVEQLSGLNNLQTTDYLHTNTATVLFCSSRIGPQYKLFEHYTTPDACHLISTLTRNLNPGEFTKSLSSCFTAFSMLKVSEDHLPEYVEAFELMIRFITDSLNYVLADKVARFSLDKVLQKACQLDVDTGYLTTFNDLAFTVLENLYALPIHKPRFKDTACLPILTTVYQCMGSLRDDREIKDLSLSDAEALTAKLFSTNLGAMITDKQTSAILRKYLMANPLTSGAIINKDSLSSTEFVDLLENSVAKYFFTKTLLTDSYIQYLLSDPTTRRVVQNFIKSRMPADTVSRTPIPFLESMNKIDLPLELEINVDGELKSMKSVALPMAKNRYQSIYTPTVKPSR